ncbi:MAG: MATE family efflux transporter [Candidatus Firestonebacteria bacterium]|nr:MATE family efflux transporter [Candidatus Firestonebacteria bacterium]
MRDFTQGSILKHLIYFAIPLMLSNMLQAVFQVVDAIWVGRLIGKDALAAVSTSMPVMFLLISLLIGMVVSTTILVGQSYGAKNYEFLSKVLSNSFMLCITLTLTISAGGIIFSNSILRLINVPENIRPDAQVFMNILLAGLVFSLITSWFMSVLNGVGNSKTPLKITFLILGLNIVLAPLLIKGFWLIPEMGVGGSALATVIANIAGTIIYYFSFKHMQLFKNAKFYFKYNSEMIKKILVIGWPASLQMIIVSGSALLVVALANKYGPTVTAAYGIGFRTDMFGSLAAFAMGNSVTSMTAQNIGAKKPERVSETLKYAVLFSCALSLLYAIIVNIFPAAIAGAFTKDAAIITGTANYFKYAGWSYIGFAVMFSLLGVIRGAGDTLGALIMVGVNLLLFRIPLCYLLSEYTPLKQNGLWLGLTLAALVGAVLLYWYYKSGRWHNKQKVF